MMRQLLNGFIFGLFIGVLLTATGAFAQGVYVTKGENGPVFSNKPTTGAKEVSLPPINVMTPVDTEKAVPPVRAQEPANVPERVKAPEVPRNEHCAVVYPSEHGSVVMNTGAFEVRVICEPALRVADGHAFKVRVNGEPVSARYQTSEFTVLPDSWQQGLPDANQMAMLDVSLVDSAGRTLAELPRVSFYLRYVVPIYPHGVRRPPYHEPRQPVERTPAPKVETERKMVGPTRKMPE